MILFLFLAIISLTEPLCNNTYLLANLELVGFYRVNYDQQNWKLIFNQLKTDFRVKID